MRLHRTGFIQISAHLRRK